MLEMIVCWQIRVCELMSKGAHTCIFMKIPKYVKENENLHPRDNKRNFIRWYKVSFGPFPFKCEFGSWCLF